MTYCEYQVVVIGGGPAGMAAAIQLRRSRIRTLLVERKELGGLMLNANRIENYLGFPEGISGPALAERFIRQLRRFDVDVRSDSVDGLDRSERHFLVGCQTETIRCRRVVIASGTRPRRPASCKIPGSARDRIHFEVHPLTDLVGERIAIVGGGDAAFDNALELGDANRILLLNRGRQTKCLPILAERLAQTPSVKYQPETEIERVETNRTAGLLLELAGPEGRREVPVDRVLFAIGREPNLEFPSSNIHRHLDGFRENGSLQLVGDVRRGRYRQVSIAAADGVEAAMRIHRSIREENRE